MAYEEILTVNSSIQSKRTTKTTANSSTEVLKDGELLIVRDGNNPPNLRAGDGTTQIKNLKDMVPGVASTSTAGLMSASDKTKLNGIDKVIKTELGKKLSLSGGTMTGALTTKGIKLTSGTDYGDTLPSDPATNQLFFQTIGSNFVLDNVYPVGSIYMSVNSTNPGTLFGGTWERIMERFLFGCGDERYPAGHAGGEEQHLLTVEEMPSHNHAMPYLPNSSADGTGFSYGIAAGCATDSEGGRGYPNLGTFSSGSGWTHNNMPPYLCVYIWKRTA